MKNSLKVIIFYVVLIAIVLFASSVVFDTVEQEKTQYSDIIDSGRTLSYLCNYLTLKGAKSVKTVTLLDKPSRREVEFTPDYHGLEVPDYFVVGYGLDYNERYRALPYVGILKPEVYTKH